MPNIDVPSLSSIRVQRALRLNNIEDGRYHHSLGLLDKDKIRSSRLINQHIRIIHSTLDYIRSSSGISPEGVHPDSTLEPIQKNKKLVGPCFMYGDRIESRRFGKFRHSVSPANMESTNKRMKPAK